jgi:hypothetical protein
MSMESSPVPSAEALRSLARAQGVVPTDEDLDAASRFLATILPALAEIEEAIPPDTTPASASAPEEVE